MMLCSGLEAAHATTASSCPRPYTWHSLSRTPLPSFSRSSSAPPGQYMDPKTKLSCSRPTYGTHFHAPYPALNPSPSCARSRFLRLFLRAIEVQASRSPSSPPGQLHGPQDQAAVPLYSRVQHHMRPHGGRGQKPAGPAQAETRRLPRVKIVGRWGVAFVGFVRRV